MIRTSRYAFQRRGPKRLALRHTRNWDDVSVRVDAVEIGTTNMAEMRRGVEFILFDHSLLRLWIEDAPAGGRTFLVNITRNGHPLPGSGNDPLTFVRHSLVYVWFLIALQLFVVGIKTRLDIDNHDKAVPLDYAALATALIIAFLGLLAWRRSSSALVAAWVLFWGEIVVWWSLNFRLGLVFLLEAIPIASATGYFMQRSIKAAWQLDAMRLPIRHPPEHAA
jgi:hypothetical protein